MANILDVTPKGLSLKFKQLLEVFSEIYHEYTDSSIEVVKNVFNTEYDLDDEIIELLFKLFGFTISDLSFFDEATRNIIKKNFVNNIFVFYRNRIKKDVYTHMLYVYGVRGDVYVLETTNTWQYFERTDYGYLDTFKFTDIGLTTDMGYTTDNLYRTPFNEIVIYLDQEHSNNTLWYVELGDAIKKDMENVRYVLSRLFYTFQLDLIATENDTITDTDRNVEMIVGDITDRFDIRKYKITFDDLTTDIALIPVISNDDVNNYYYNFTTQYDEDKVIEKIELLSFDEGTVYVTINCPDIYLEEDDKINLNLMIQKN